MRDENDWAEPKDLNNRREVIKLLLETVGPGRLVGRAKSQEIERNDATTSRRQVGNKVVIDMQIVGKTMHKHESRAGAVVIARVNAALAARDVMFGETWLVAHGVLVEAASQIRTAAFRCQ